MAKHYKISSVRTKSKVLETRGQIKKLSQVEYYLTTKRPHPVGEGTTNVSANPLNEQQEPNEQHHIFSTKVLPTSVFSDHHTPQTHLVVAAQTHLGPVMSTYHITAAQILQNQTQMCV